MENFPPTTDTLFQHARRAAYQASIWTTSHIEHNNKYLQLHHGDGNGMRVVEAGIRLDH